MLAQFAGSPDAVRRVERDRARLDHAAHTTAEIIERAVAAAHSGRPDRQRRDAAATTSTWWRAGVFVPSANGRFRAAATALSHRRRRPAAAAPGAATGRAHRSGRARAARADARQPRSDAALPLDGASRSRPHRLVGRAGGHAPARDLRRGGHPRRIGRTPGRHAHGRRHDGRQLRAVVGGVPALPAREQQQARHHARPRPRDRSGAARAAHPPV